MCYICTYVRTYVPVKHTSVVLPGRSTGGSSLSERKWCDSCGLLASGVTAVIATGCLKWLVAERVTLNSLYYGRGGGGEKREGKRGRGGGGEKRERRGRGRGKEGGEREFSGNW